MNEAETRAEHIDPALAKAGWGVVEGTHAFLLFLEQKGWVDSASDVERRAIQAGRAFSKLHFPPA